jgi:hypothetical protein
VFESLFETLPRKILAVVFNRVNSALNERFGEQRLGRFMPFEGAFVLRIDTQNIVQKNEQLFRIFADRGEPEPGIFVFRIRLPSCAALIPSRSIFSTSEETSWLTTSFSTNGTTEALGSNSNLIYFKGY